MAGSSMSTFSDESLREFIHGLVVAFPRHVAELQIRHSFQIVGVTSALHCYLRGRAVYFAQILWSQFYRNGSDVLFQAR
jgi:hypothetical protein